MKERDKNLKQANFSFGHFSNKPVAQTSQAAVDKHAKAFHAEMAKQSQLAKQSKIKGVMTSSGNNLAPSSKPDDGQDTFKSMAQVLFDEKPNVGDHAKNVSSNLMKDLRSSHFQFGNNEEKGESCSHKDHPRFEIDQKEVNAHNKLVKKMQSAHFMLGSNKSMPPMSSTYKDSISLNAKNIVG